MSSADLEAYSATPPEQGSEFIALLIAEYITTPNYVGRLTREFR